MVDEPKLVEELKKLEPGFLPYDIFVQLARLVVMPIVEFVPLRIRDNKVEVLLLDRATNDPIWPGEIHVPGTVVRVTDVDSGVKGAFQRIVEDELEGIKMSDAHYVSNILHSSKRGAEFAQIFGVEIGGEPTVGKFYAAHNLPDNLIDSQKDFILHAIEDFRKVKNLPY